jgi:hypothetical protein
MITDNEDGGAPTATVTAGVGGDRQPRSGQKLAAARPHWYPGPPEDRSTSNLLRRCLVINDPSTDWRVFVLPYWLLSPSAIIIVEHNFPVWLYTIGMAMDTGMGK